MVSLRHICMAVATLTLILGPVRRSSAQEETVDVTFEHVAARAAIEQLARSLGKSVAFDIKFPERYVDFDAKGVTPTEALRRLLDNNDLFSVEMEGVLIVAADTREARKNYSARRIEACHIPSQGSVVSDIVFHMTSGEGILKTLTTSMGLTAVFASGTETAHRPYSVELRGIRRAGAISVLCLVLHLSVRANGDELVFGGPTTG
jgi:hypothetical protein